MEKKIAVLGTGAIGGSIGADFTQAGYDVTLIDQWPAHVEAMKAHGLRFKMIRTGEEFQVPVKAIHLCELASLKPRFDIVFLASKAYDSHWLAQLIEPYLKPDGVLVSTQNSLCDEWISPTIGARRDIGCAVELSAQVFDPGLVKRNTDQTTSQFVVGELDGKITPRVKEVAKILGTAGKTGITANIWGAKWCKLIQSTASLTIQAVFGVPGIELLEDPAYLDFSIKVGCETVRVGNALGNTLEPIFEMAPDTFNRPIEEQVRIVLFKIISDLGKCGTKDVEKQLPKKAASEFNTGTEGWVSCVLQDLLKGRRTETSLINGLVAKKGREVNVPAPINEAVSLMMDEIEQGKRKMANRDNFKVFEKWLDPEVASKTG